MLHGFIQIKEQIVELLYIGGNSLVSFVFKLVTYSFKLGTENLDNFLKVGWS